VPLSENARRLLDQRSGRAPAEAKEQEEDRTGFRERARREEERFRLATDTEYWLTFCFRTPGALTQFLEALQLTPDDRGYVPGPVLDEATAGRSADNSPRARAKRMLSARATRGDATATARLTARPAPDPFAAMPDVNDIQQAADLELATLYAALTAPPGENLPDVLDSPHWLAAYWPSREGKDAYLTRTGLDAVGDKYLDGHQAAQILGV
jgi:hypothetical protein